MGRNMIRDQTMAFVLSKGGYFPVFDFMHGAFSLAKKDADFQNWLKSEVQMRPLYRWIGNIYSFNWIPLPKFKASHAKPGMWRRVHSRCCASPPN